jgi:formylglycine-generating enzyme required for sulfatase activity
MSHWFLSYHSPDQALAARLKAAIERKDPAQRVFFAPSHNRAGGFWTAQLAHEIADATAFILLVGEHGIGPWQVLEYHEALDRRVKSPDFPLIVVLLEGQTAPGLPFLRRLHWIVTPEPDSEKDIARLFDAASGSGTRPGELWRHASPYRGLAAMQEKDSDYFFGRARETVDVLSGFAAAPDRLPLLIGNSGVGKSSLAQAGVLAALKRQAWPEGSGETETWPHGFADSRRWCFLTVRPGVNPLQALVEPFLQIWQFDPTDPRREMRRTEWIENLREGRNTLSGLLTATEARLEEQGQPSPPGFFLYVDQGEELYTRAGRSARLRFSEIVAQGLNDPRLRAMMSLRADFFGDFQKDVPLCAVHRQINVLPLRETQLRDVVSRPAALLSARFETDSLAGDIAKRAAEESTEDAGALPLLSYLLEDIWQRMVERGDGVLRLPAQSIDLGRVLVERADAFMRRHPGSEDDLRRIFTLKLATVREDGEPTRRRASRSEFSDNEWRLVSELADDPNRLLITGALAVSVAPSGPQAGAADAKAAATYAEVAHEAIFRRWDKLQEWIDAERVFLAWRSRLEAAHRAWQAAPDNSRNDALLMGLALAQAQSWRAKRADDLSKLDTEFIDLSVDRARATQRRSQRTRTLLRALVFAVLVGLGYEAWSSNREYLKINTDMLIDQLRPKVLAAPDELTLKPKQTFKECTHCPEMVVVPPGEFDMGSRPGETDDPDSIKSENPRHRVTIASRFAVSVFEVTFAEWDACVARGGCDYSPGDQNWGRGKRPVLNISWYDALQYAAWISKETGKPYMLLSEAEWEYAARAGSDTAYYWGDKIGQGNANCDGCRSQWDDKQTAPVGSFAPNAFGLYDMIGNVFQWVEDCFHTSYDGEPPIDGSAWTMSCPTKEFRVVRGGSYINYPQNIRAAARRGYSPGFTVNYVGFRLKRALAP